MGRPWSSKTFQQVDLDCWWKSKCNYYYYYNDDDDDDDDVRN